MSPAFWTWVGAMVIAAIATVVIFLLTFALADLLTPGTRGRR